MLDGVVTGFEGVDPVKCTHDRDGLQWRAASGHALQLREDDPLPRIC